MSGTNVKNYKYTHEPPLPMCITTFYDNIFHNARSLSCSPSPPPLSFTQSPSLPRSLVRDGQTSPHRPRLVVSRLS
jgi:hypothetical protein